MKKILFLILSKYFWPSHQWKLSRSYTYLLSNEIYDQNKTHTHCIWNEKQRYNETLIHSIWYTLRHALLFSSNKNECFLAYHFSSVSLFIAYKYSAQATFSQHDYPSASKSNVCSNFYLWKYCPVQFLNI